MLFLRTMVQKFVFWSVVLLALVALTGVKALWNNQNALKVGGGYQHDFNYWQSKYKDVAYALSNDPAVKEAIQESPIEVKQVTVGQFAQIQQDGTQQQRVDRCQSCHIGLDNPSMTAENIIQTVDHKTVATADVAAYLEDPKHADTREIVETLGAHPGTDIEGAGKQQDLGVAHSPHLSYGVTTNDDPNASDADKTDYQTQKVNLKQHPFATFGCTTCHYGSGRDLVQYKAHQFVDDLPEGDIPDEAHIIPIPGTQMLPAKYMDAACAQCHATYNDKTFKINYLNTANARDENGNVTASYPVLQTITRGEQLFQQQACYGCHKIDGFSKGNIGPELTNEGRSKPFEGVEHQIWDPRYSVGTCVMPYFFSVRKTNTDLPSVGIIGSPSAGTEIVDPRAKRTQAADIPNSDIRDSLKQHGYIADASRQADVDALVTFVISQTGQNFADSQASRFTTIAAYNKSVPPDVAVSAAEGKKLFETSGCYACHYIGDPNRAHVTGDPQFGKGGIAGPELSWEGARHSQQWLVAHYANPQAFVPGSIMPIFPFSNSQRAALSLYDAAQMPDAPGARPVSPDQDMTTDQQTKMGIENNEIRYMTR
jgi:cbb3-type cytochrome oxidase cytochrome c subunit